MKKKTFILLILTLICNPTFGQTKTDLDKDKLFGKIKSILTFSVNYENEKDTVYNYKKLFNENGMEVNFVNFNPNIRFDSIIKKYDNLNRLIKKIEFTKGGNFMSTDREKFIETLIYNYDNNCYKPSKIEDSNSNYKIIYKFDERCNTISENIIENYKETSKTFKFDNQYRLIKKTVSNLGEKADLEETLTYDDINNTIITIQYNPKKNVYYSKVFTKLAENKKVLEVVTYQEEKLIAGKLFGSESPQISDNISGKVKYEYDNSNLIREISFDGKNNELYKVENSYTENGELKEERIYKAVKLEFRKEYTYENGKLINEKKYLPNEKEPEYIKSWKYNSNGKIIELYHLLKDGDKYSNVYLYDDFSNEIEERIFENGELIKKKLTKIEYYK